MTQMLHTLTGAQKQELIAVANAQGMTHDALLAAVQTELPAIVGTTGAQASNIALQQAIERALAQ